MASGRTRGAALVLALAAALTLAGCGQGGQGAPVAPRTMTVSSEAFIQNMLPQRYTCHGAPDQSSGGVIRAPWQV